jgi:hypothetical protein
MFGDFLGGFFSFLANGHHRAYLTISAVKSIAAIFLFAPFWLPLSACIFEKAVGVMLVHVHLATLLAT